MGSLPLYLLKKVSEFFWERIWETTWEGCGKLTGYTGVNNKH
jgi:hypothetical protein